MLPPSKGGSWWVGLNPVGYDPSPCSAWGQDGPGPRWRSPSVRSSAPQVDVMRSALKGHHGDLHPSLRPPERQTEDPKTQQEQVFKKVLESPDTHWHIYVHWPPNNGTTLTDRQSYASPNPAPQTRLFQTPSRVDEGSTARSRNSGGQEEVPCWWTV